MIIFSGLKDEVMRMFQRYNLLYCDKKINNIMKKFMEFWGVYYPIVLAFLSFLYSVTLWFTGNQLEGIFVGIWVPSILSASVALRQRRTDSRKEKRK